MTTPLTARLAALDPEQLSALVERLVAQHPEMEDLIHLPLPGEATRADGAAVQRQVSRIVRTMGDDWMASTRAEHDLWPILEVGNAHRSAGRIEDARTVYRAVIDGILTDYEDLRDEESELVHVIEECIEGIGACLDATTDPALRQRCLRDAFDVYRWDAFDHGGYGMDESAEEVLCSRAVGSERAQIAAWIRVALPKDVDRHGFRQRQRGGALVLRLIGDHLDDRAREALYSEANMVRERLELLLREGRREEAVDVVRRSHGADVEVLADRLVAAGLEAEASAVVDQHPAFLEPTDCGLRAWRAAHGGLDAEQLDELVCAMDAFRRRPDLRRWDLLREEAKAAGRWTQVLPFALAAVHLDKTGVQPLRVRVLAAAGRFDEAEAILQTVAEGSWKSPALDLAAAAEQERPALSIALYEKVAEGLRARKTSPARKERALIEATLAKLRGRTRPA